MTPGTTLSHYEIEAELGRGGMGIVYKARDTKLNRQVAIKVLPASALTSEDDRARFFREAQSAAQLTHPHIATIYQIDEAIPVDAQGNEIGAADGVRPFIAMEFIDGATLEEQIKEGPLKLNDAVEMAKQVADALGAAHDRDIVHRDIKSANIMLTSAGKAKVLDFGLALTAQSTKLTRMGSTLGTVAYMSPEQARGEEVDRRTDIWALGVVMYEMITGANPFGGDYEQAVVYSILNEDPEPVTGLRTGVPMEFELIIDKCLRKDAAHRYQTALDLQADLAALSLPSRGSRTTRVSTPAAEPVSKTDSTVALPVSRMAGLWALGLLIGALAMWWLTGSATPVTTENEGVIRSSIVLPEANPLMFTFSSTGGLERSALDVTRDGKHMVFRTRGLDQDEMILAIRDMASGEVELLEGTDDADNPVFSPDGNSVGFVMDGAIYRVPRQGGRPRFVASASDPTGLVWHEDGYMYWGDMQGGYLSRIAMEGEAEVERNELRCDCGLPTQGPDGTGVVVSGRDREVVTWWHWGEEPVQLNIPGYHVRFLKGNRVIYTRTGAMYAATVDPSTGLVNGEETLLLDDVRTGSLLRSAHYAVTDGGTLIYGAGEPSGQVDVVIRAADGTESLLGIPTGVYGPISVSPDDRYVVIQNLEQGGLHQVHDRQTGSSQILFSDDLVSAVIWSSDNNSIIYAILHDDGSTFYRRDLRTAADTELFEGDESSWPSAISPDGRFLAYRTAQTTLSVLKVRDLETGEEEVINREEGVTLWAPDFSRDGRFLSYTRVGEGGSQIFVEPFPRDGSFRLISTSGGEEAEMLLDEDALVYRNGSSWYKIRYGDTLDSFSESELLFDDRYVNIAGMEYRAMTGGDMVLQRPVNTSISGKSAEVIFGLYRLIDEQLISSDSR